MDRIHSLFCAIVLSIFLSNNIYAEDLTLARIVSSRPEAWVVQGENKKQSVVDTEVLRGAGLETDQYGRMSILLPDQMLLKVAEESLFIYEGISDTGVKGQLKYGRVWLRGQRKGKPFSVETPTATAAIRGTEWYMEVGGDGTTTVGVVDGEVEVSNKLGAVSLGAKELALVKPGQPPIKMAYLTPENAVNWTLNYIGLWDKSDIAHAGPGFGPLVSKALSDYDRNDLRSAVAILERARGSYGNSAPFQVLSGFLSLVSGKDADARKSFAKATSLDPKWALPWAHLALVELVENHLDKAVEASNKALEAEPNSVVGLITKAYVQKASLNLEEAYKTLRKATELSPDFDGGNITAATIALEMGDLKSAKERIARIPANASLAAKKEMLLGYIALRQGNPEAALSSFEKSVSGDPETPDALVGLGVALFNLNRVDEGVDAISRATLMAPQVSAYQSYLAKAYFDIDRFNDSVHALRRAGRLDEKDPTPHLYEGIILYSLYRPTRALAKVEEANALNHNRAVFRSRYLLDQDQSVLMSNIAQIYNEVGFDRSSTQEASRALELDPTNEAAHRRLYFALLFDPRGYDQAANSELLLNKLFMPPTRTAVVLDEKSLSPYQSLFNRAGTDKVLSGQYYGARSNSSDTGIYNGTGIVSGKLEEPFAYAIQISPSFSNLDSNTTSSTEVSGVTTRTDAKNEQDSNTEYSSALFKWQPSLNVGVFGDVKSTFADTDSSTGLDQNIFFNDIPLSSTPLSDNTSDSNLKRYSVDTGVHIKHDNGLESLYHLSFRHEGSDTTSLTSAPSFPGDISTDATMETNQWVSQAALWKHVGSQLIQVGVRHYGDDGDVESDTRGTGFETKYETGQHSHLSSVFLTHEFALVDDVHTAWSVQLDDGKYTLKDGRSNDRNSLSPALGMAWDVNPAWRLRGAYIENLAGDRGERLDQSMIAGFPRKRLALVDPFSPEEVFTLKYRTLQIGSDFKLSDPLTFVGLEGFLDSDYARHLDPAGTDTLIDIDNRSRGLLFYTESLLTETFAAGTSYRVSTFTLPEDYLEHKVTAYGGYFLDRGLAIKLKGSLIAKDPDSEASSISEDKLWEAGPSIEGYPFSHKVRLGVFGKLDNASNRAITVRFTWFL